MDHLSLVYDVWRMLWRRAVPIAIVTVIGVIFSAFVAFILPPEYETRARILVESQQIPGDLVRTTVTSTAYERLKLIEQRIMARDNLIQLIGRLDLFADRTDMKTLDKVEALRDATRIESEAIGQNSWNSAVVISAFSVVVRFGDPEEAANIANEFVSTVLQRNLAQRSEQARETLRFFETERDRLAAEIATLDREISAFKVENEDALPESVEFRRAELTRLSDTRLDIDRQILELEERRSELASGLSAPSTGVESPAEALLRQLETELVSRREVLAETHPEIRSLQRRIASLRDLVGAPAAEDGGLDVAEGSPRGRQIALLTDQITALAAQQEEIELRRLEIEASLSRTPAIEGTLTALERRRDDLLDQYDSVIAKRAEAATGERIEVGQQGERFEVIENALAPDSPIAPSRKKILLLGAMASMGAALALALLLELLNPAIRSSAQFQRQLKLTPLAAIPHVATRAERFRRSAILATAGLFIAAAVPTGLWAIDQHIRPIQSILDTAAERTGLDDVVRIVRTRL